MGWWGYNIMEGDTPCDLQIVLEEQLTEIGIDLESFKPSSQQLLDICKHEEMNYIACGETHLIGQVVGFMAIINEWPMCDVLAERVIADCDTEINGENYFDDPSQRIKHLEELKWNVGQYLKGNYIYFTPQYGLFDQIGRRLGKGPHITVKALTEKGGKHKKLLSSAMKRWHEQQRELNEILGN
jgi:hypothetical protein